MTRMSVTEFSNYAGLHPDTVRRKCASGEFAALKFGKRWIVLVEETEALCRGGNVERANDHVS